MLQSRAFREAPLFFCFAVGFISQNALAQDGDVKAGRAKAEVCAPCHGIDGISKIAEAPNIAGQNPSYMLEQLQAFQSGERVNPMMSIVVKDLTASDIDNLIAYYSSIAISVGKLPGD